LRQEAGGLSLPDETSAGGREPDDLGDPEDPDEARARLAALAAHPRTAQLMEPPPPESGQSAGVWSQLGALVLLVIGGLGLTIVFFGVCPPLGFVPLALVLLGAYAIVRQMTRPPQALATARVQAYVVDAGARFTERGEQVGSATVHATLQLADGSRRVLEVSEGAASALAPGAVGVATVEGERIVAFERVRV